MTRKSLVFGSAVITVLMLSSTALAVPMFESTGDLGNNIIVDAGEFSWTPHLISPSNSGINELTVKYGLWQGQGLTVDILVNSNFVGSFLADFGYIIPGPKLATFEVTGFLDEGNNTILFTGNSVSAEAYVVGQVDLRYDTAPPSPVPEPSSAALIGIGLLALRLRSRFRRRKKVSSP